MNELSIDSVQRPVLSLLRLEFISGTAASRLFENILIFVNRGFGMWTEIYGLAGSTLATLGRKNLFLIVKVETNAVVVRPLETAVDRRIPRKEIEGAYDELRLRGTMTLAQIRSFSEMNPVYVAAMLSQILGVTYVNKPKIQLSVLVNR